MPVIFFMALVTVMSVVSMSASMVEMKLPMMVLISVAFMVFRIA